MKRHKILLSGILSAVSSNLLWAQNRFPKPDFESGYEYPEIHYAMQNESFWVTIDIFLLILLMSIVAWAALKRRTRKPILWVSVISVLYFGFYRTGCVCSIGSIQNVSLALADNTYILPVSVLLFFILPVLFALLFGRVFCAGVCPFGALQELVNIKNYRLSKVVTTILSIIPWLVLIFAVLYAVTRSSFIICRFEPFIGIFRLGGDIGLILFGTILLILSIFIGRPFCRFLCPYGALLSLFSAVSVWKIKLTSKACINCELCHNACPVDAIRSPYGNKVKESRQQGVKRLIAYFIILPVIIAAFAVLFNYLSEDFSKVNKEVKLYDMIQQQENNPQDVLPLELETFYGQGYSTDELALKYEKIQQEFKLYSTISGALAGLIIGLILINLSLKRTRKEYEIDHASCVMCCRCFKYCPQNINGIKPDNRS